MLTIKSDKDKLIHASMQLDQDIEKGIVTKENTIFIVSNDILDIDKKRYEVVQIQSDKQKQDCTCKIIEVFDTKEAAQA